MYVVVRQGGLTNTDRLYRLDPISKTAPAYWEPDSIDKEIYMSPVIDGDGNIYIGTAGDGDGQGKLYKLSADLGTELWSIVCTDSPFATDRDGFFTTPLLAADGKLYVTVAAAIGSAHDIGCIRTSDGAILWKSAAPQNQTDLSATTGFFSSLAMDKRGTIFVTGDDKKLRAIVTTSPGPYRGSWAKWRCTPENLGFIGNPQVMEVPSSGPVIGSIRSITPASGNTMGNTLVTIDGDGFIGTITVTIGGVAATSVSVNALKNQITCRTPTSATTGAKNVVVTSSVNGTLTRVNGYTYVATFGSATNLSVGANPRGLAAADLNADGKLDLVVTNYSSGNVSVLLGNGDGTFTSNTTSTAGANCWGVAIADLDGDSKLDLAVTNYTPGTVSVLKGNGNGTFTNNTTPTVGNNPVGVAIGKIDSGNTLDLAVANNGSNSVSVLLGDGTLGFQVSNPNPAISSGFNPMDIVLGTFGSGTTLDVAVTNYGGSTVSVRLGDGAGAFPSSSNPAVGIYPFGMAAGLLDGDGYLDLAVANYNSGSVSVLLGNADGTFNATSSIALSTAPRGLSAADLNGDGKVDLATANNEGNVSVLQGNGLGNFTEIPGSPYTAGSGPYDVVIGDFNGDGKPDLATTNDAANTVSVLLQR